MFSRFLKDANFCMDPIGLASFHSIPLASRGPFGLSLGDMSFEAIATSPSEDTALKSAPNTWRMVVFKGLRLAAGTVRLTAMVAKPRTCFLSKST